MKVTVVNKCNRCKREAPLEIEHTQIEPLQAAEQSRQTNFDTLKASIANVAGVLPDLIVVFKGTVQSIDHVCEASCVTTIGHQLEAMFREIDPTKRAPRKTRTPGETPTEGSQTSETPAEPVKKKNKNVVEGDAHSTHAKK